MNSVTAGELASSRLYLITPEQPASRLDAHMHSRRADGSSACTDDGCYNTRGATPPISNIDDRPPISDNCNPSTQEPCTGSRPNSTTYDTHRQSGSSYHRQSLGGIVHSKEHYCPRTDTTPYKSTPSRSGAIISHSNYSARTLNIVQPGPPGTSNARPRRIAVSERVTLLPADGTSQSPELSEGSTSDNSDNDSFEEEYIPNTEPPPKTIHESVLHPLSDDERKSAFAKELAA